MIKFSQRPREKKSLILLTTALGLVVTFENCSRVSLRSAGIETSESSSLSQATPGGTDQILPPTSGARPAADSTGLRVPYDQASCTSALAQMKALGANLPAGNGDPIAATVVRHSSPTAIASVRGTDVFVKAPSVGQASGTSLAIIAETIGTAGGTDVLASAAQVTTFSKSTVICAAVDRLDHLTSSYNGVYLSPRTAARGQIGTLDLRQTTTVYLAHMHVDTLIDCPNKFHLNVRMTLDHSDYDHLVLQDGPGCF